MQIQRVLFLVIIFFSLSVQAHKRLLGFDKMYGVITSYDQKTGAKIASLDLSNYFTDSKGEKRIAVSAGSFFLYFVRKNRLIFFADDHVFDIHLKDLKIVRQASKLKVNHDFDRELSSYDLKHTFLYGDSVYVFRDRKMYRFDLECFSDEEDQRWGDLSIYSKMQTSANAQHVYFHKTKKCRLWFEKKIEEEGVNAITLVVPKGEVDENIDHSLCTVYSKKLAKCIAGPFRADKLLLSSSPNCGLILGVLFEYDRCQGNVYYSALTGKKLGYLKTEVFYSCDEDIVYSGLRAFKLRFRLCRVGMRTINQTVRKAPFWEIKNVHDTSLVKEEEKEEDCLCCSEQMERIGRFGKYLVLRRGAAVYRMDLEAQNPKPELILKRVRSIQKVEGFLQIKHFKEKGFFVLNPRTMARTFFPSSKNDKLYQVLQSDRKVIVVGWPGRRKLSWEKTDTHEMRIATVGGKSDETPIHVMLGKASYWHDFAECDRFIILPIEAVQQEALAK